MIRYDGARPFNYKPEFTTIRTNKKVTYLNIPAGFDIETTSTTYNGDKVANMYVWMFGVGHGEPIYYGRTWGELLEFCNSLSECFNLSESRRLVVYVHNLGYEFQFMRKYFSWSQVFAVADRKPIKALCDLGIEFRDSYILSGYSLANTAKNLTKHTVKKLVGDLDYGLVRHHKTPLTKKELDYCSNDIEIITAYIDEQIQLYGDVAKIPATNTGRVRKYVRENCYYTSKNHRKSSRGKYTRYRKIMNDLTLAPDNYIQCKRAFMGGFTHANAMHSGKTLQDVSSIDFTSSYPSVMVAEKFPMSRFRPIEIESKEQLQELIKNYAVIMDVKFYKLTPKIHHENYLSESKCYNVKNLTVNNGRVAFADECAITLTEIDFEIMRECYEWEKLEIDNVIYAHKNYLPKPIVESILTLYQKKTELKDVAGYETEYMLSKGMLNSIYGMSVTDIVKDNAIYSDEWDTEKVDLIEEIESYNTSKNRFLYYPWGLWVTAYARKNLWSGILATGGDYVYSDTDSLKVLNIGAHSDYIEAFNTRIIEKMKAALDHHKLDHALLNPKTKQGIIKTLGVWDFEGTYDRFKTLGAKRYLTQTGDRLELTVAGLSKQNGIKHLLELAGGEPEKVFDLFTKELYIPAEKTGKMTHTYIDELGEFVLTDYKGVSEIVEQQSAIHLEKCEFTLSIARQYEQFLKQLAKGYIYTGLKHI